MSKGDMTIIKGLLQANTRKFAEGEKLRIFEWGSGTSTIYYSKFLRSIGQDFEWHASENSAAWFERTEEMAKRTQLSGHITVHLSEFPAFWELPQFTWENPIPPQALTESPNAVKYVEKPLELGGRFDLMIVDGRFRRRCLLAAKKVLAPGGVVFLHDAQKTQYHTSITAFPHSKFVTTGSMPGSSQKSTIALCCEDSETLIEKY